MHRVSVGEASVAEIARSTGYSRQAVQRLADALVEEGSARYSADEADRRRQRIELTEAGAATFEEIEAHFEGWAGRLVGRISERDLVAVSEALDRIRLVLDADRDHIERGAVTMPEERISLVTGGNKGLGFETARRLGAAGHNVYIGARNEERGRAAAGELGVGFVRLDVTDGASVAEAAAELERREERREGRLDVLVNNAGIPGPYKDAADLTGEDAEGVFGTNVVGIVRVTHAFLPLLERSDAPTIVNVTSGTGSFELVHDPERIESSVRMPLYSASKAAVTMLTVQYAKALPHVRVNAADPGYTATDFNANNGTQIVAEGTDAIFELASAGADGPTGAFIDREGPVGW